MTKLTPYRQQSCPTSLGATSTKGIGFLMKKPNYFAISFLHLRANHIRFERKRCGFLNFSIKLAKDEDIPAILFGAIYFNSWWACWAITCHNDINISYHYWLISNAKAFIYIILTARASIDLLQWWKLSYIWSKMIYLLGNLLRSYGFILQLGRFSGLLYAQGQNTGPVEAEPVSSRWDKTTSWSQKNLNLWNFIFSSTNYFSF